MLEAILGGALIGLAASLFWSLNRRIAGISGILSSALLGRDQERRVSVAFLSGLVIAGVAFAISSLRVPAPRLPVLALSVAGLLVGFGTRLGGGCSSGHGVCGLSRFSVRSLVAVLTFIASGSLTVFLVRHLLKIGLPS